MILLDTSGMLAALDATQTRHEAAAAAVRAAQPPLLLSPFVLCELDYLVTKSLGQTAELALLGEVASGAYRLEGFEPGDVADARVVAAAHRDLRLGLADASLVVLAYRHDAHDVLTLDERHFRVLQGPRGPFRILPADA